MATLALREMVIAHKAGKRGVKYVTLKYGTATANRTGNGMFNLVIGLSARAAREVKLLGAWQVTIAVTFTPTGGSPRHATRKVTVQRNRKGKYS